MIKNAPNAPKKRHRKSRIVPILTSLIPDKEGGPDEPHMVGYARVSTDEQNAQRQVDELVLAGVAAVDVFSDKGTGANMDRPGWDACTKDLRAGDILVIHSLDRLSRNLVDTMQTLKALNDRGVRVKVLTMDFDSTTPMGRFVFSMMAAFAQFERRVIVERTLHGLAAARARGVYGGASKKYTDEAIREAVGALGVVGAARKLGASKVTIIRRMKAMEP